MAVMLFAMLAMAAFAIDLASLRSARSETQRAADAIALAGASAFYDLPSGDATATDEAQTRALDIARLNMVRGDTLYVDNPVVTTKPNAYPGGGFVRTVADPGRDPEHHPGDRQSEGPGLCPAPGRADILRRLDREALWARPGHGHRLGQQRGTDAQVPQAVPDPRHVVRDQ